MLIEDGHPVVKKDYNDVSYTFTRKHGSGIHHPNKQLVSQGAFVHLHVCLSEGMQLYQGNHVH